MFTERDASMLAGLGISVDPEDVAQSKPPVKRISKLALMRRTRALNALAVDLAEELDVCQARLLAARFSADQFRKRAIAAERRLQDATGGDR